MTHRIRKALFTDNDPERPALIIIATGPYPWQPWTSTKSRKAHRCVVGGCNIHKGDQLFRPIDNGLNRKDRICARCMADMIRAYAREVIRP